MVTTLWWNQPTCFCSNPIELVFGKVKLVVLHLVLVQWCQWNLTLNSSYNHNALTTYRTFLKESLQMHFKVAVKNFMLVIQAAQVIPSQHSHIMLQVCFSTICHTFPQLGFTRRWLQHSTNLGSQEGTSNIPPTWVYKKAAPTFHQLECTRRQLQHHQLGLTRRHLQLIALQCSEELRAEYKVEISVFNPCMFCMGWWNCRNSTTAYGYRGDACN